MKTLSQNLFSQCLALALSLLALGTVGCHSQGQTGALPAAARDDLADGRYGWEGIAHACAQIPDGRFRDFKKECECPSLAGREEVPEIFSLGEGPSCQGLRYTNHCEGEEGFRRALLDEGIAGLNNCLRDVAQFGRSHVTVEVAENISERDATKVARFFDSYRDRFFAKLWPTRGEDFFSSTLTVVVGKKTIDKDFIQSVLAPPARGERKSYRATYFEPEADNFQNALGHPLDVPRASDAPSTAIKNRFAAAEFVTALGVQVVTTNLSAFQGEVWGDCRRDCVLRANLGSDASGRFKAEREKSYLAGAPYRDIVWVDEISSATRLAAIHLNPRGGVSTVLFISAGLDGVRDEMGATVTVYDRKWNPLGEEWFSWLTGFSATEKLLARLPVAASSIPGAVVLCENVSIALAGNKSPYVAATAPSAIGEGSSMLGWLRPTYSWAGFLDPLVELEGGAIANASSTAHGDGVARALLSVNRDAKLIPISFTSCLERYRDWAGAVAGRGVKVVQLAGAVTSDERACDARYATSEMFSARSPFLWVMAAGNSGLRNPTNRCPQNAAGNRTTLVVAGGAGGGLWSDSDYGAQYADLTATYTFNGSSGTSYSSPRVAAVAARIAESVPRLTPAGLRAILLFSADVPFHPLEVRSGGELNANRALELARAWDASGYTEAKLYDHTVLSYLLGQRLELEEVERRIQVWRDNGLL